MITKYESLIISDEAIAVNIRRLINQIFKLLPCREEKQDWEQLLKIIIEDIVGMSRVLIEYHTTIFKILCRLEGLFELQDDEDFPIYRRTVFECISSLEDLRKEILGLKENDS